MAWSMHPGQRYDEVRARWNAPPPGDEGQPPSVDARTATDLMGERADDAPAPR
jgi:hypothetical protein